MIGTNIYISQENQESLIKAAALKEMSVEELATSILRESIQEKLGKSSYSTEGKRIFATNPLREMQPYAYLANANEPVISPDDWEMNQDNQDEVNDL
ncbi:hypothetical protein G7B40_006245 [Aetokthonos hydrillicola Thurmond2011]|jgi:hypothetical protein|uniref:Uncharacterized protein n=1 Tax=Aetokthonos hydrillicola Thurmond2011 TaxID=2712845 RepID=A0AAP5I310_9CYAN|nr:hypothetical protein [Aetokthonos hydrillicola]MBO3463997.1 hypothetical protein [Aetokthonos hydrillicola CCALA 1050]MBW4585069.1 hypothetical protein [Aetokthonos hydrillicola CCALA 1050]MDR9894172.1 hypothetical protein [Aetokthonos hydrillicola Thurmond2011]